MIPLVLSLHKISSAASHLFRFVKHDPFRFIVVSPLLDLCIFSDSHAAEQIKKCDMEEGACRGLTWA